MAKKTSFYVTDEFTKVYDKYCKRYGSPSKAIASTMLCLDAMYRTERRALNELFTRQELSLMLDNAMSTHYDPRHIIGTVLADTEDEIQAQFDFYEVDRDTLLSKLRGLTVSQQYALVDLFLEMRGDAAPEAEDEG